MLKRLISLLLSTSIIFAVFPVGAALADETGITEISNQYIKVIVNNKNGGYVISTLEGDVLKKSDNNVSLTHRGENFDTSFTSFKIGNEEYVFGEKYGLFGNKSTDVVTKKDSDGSCIKSVWGIGDFEVEQSISLVNNDASEQLGTAMITYTVKNNSKGNKTVKSRVLIDTQLGENDYGYYEVPKQNLGQGYEYFEFERTWDSTADPTVRMPSDYFVRDNPYSSNIVGYGVNSVFSEQKPYKMTFAHWANIAETVFDYEPDETLNFTNCYNDKKTADSAAALYYDLGNIAAGEEKSFSTYYGVTANLKNRENKIIINTTAPSKLEFKDNTRLVYKGSEGTDNVARINIHITNPMYAEKNYKKLAVVVYALGFDTQRQTDGEAWIQYDNNDPIYTNVVDFNSGDNRVTYFDFKFTPKERAQLGTFVIKVFDMDEDVNELGYYAEEYCLATSENHIILPGQDKNLPAITLTELSPNIIYNQDIRYITVSGRGMEFFGSELLDKILLCSDDGNNYEIPIENLTFEQGDNPMSVSIMLEEYMEPGRYQLHFKWKTGTSEAALDGVPADFTSDGMIVQVSSDIKYYNACYGIVTVQRSENDKYKLVPYKTETEFEKAKIKEEDLLLSFRGDILQDRANKNFYRLFGKDKDININYILNYHGDDLTLEEKSDGTVEVLMDGKITTVGANTTVRNGTAAFRLKGGTEYIIPEYDKDGKVEENGELVGGQDFIELKWDNAFDTLTTVGGFLIDMKYGVLGKIQNDDKTKSDIISFGGSLDLSFMTPGGAAAVRQNTAEGAKWTTKGTELKYDDSDDGYSFGLTFDEDSGEFRSQVAEKDIPPTNKEASRVEAGATIHDVLYGGKNPGYIGINMDAHITMPQIVKFLPNKIEGELSINTIGKKYEVGVDAEVETGNVAMALSLVVKSSPSGAPIPDKLYFTIGGFEPGINVDNLGVLWITGGGGGLDNLYDTIYGKDGVPPLTVLLHVEFDITKILTGNADLELSLRSLKLSFSDLSLKMLKNAKFIDGGEVAVGWYPNFNLNLSAGVNFAQIMKGSFTITAAAGRDTADFVQFVLNVAIGLPQYIPIVGGMELASAELGGGSQKVWGSVEVLSLIKVGFTYYWGGDIEFTHGNASGSGDFATLAATDDAGVRRTKIMYNNMLEPVKVGTDSDTGEEQFAAVGGNLSYSAGSKAVFDFEERVKAANSSGIRLMSLNNAETEIYTDSERKSHLVSFGESSDYILSVSRADGSELSADDLKKHMSIKHKNKEYELRYYTAPNHDATDEQKKKALEDANINVAKNAAYIAIPKSDATGNMLIEFSDDHAYDISAIKVNPISTLKSCSAQVNGNVLSVNWDGENISDSAKIIVFADDGNEENGIVLNESEIFAKSKSADIEIPEKMSSGEYHIKLVISDENISYEGFDAGTVTIKNSKAPEAAVSVSMENCGDDKLKINVGTANDDFDGYLVEVYEEEKLADAGLYFEKGEEIVVGGRYEMPEYDEKGNPTGKSVSVGYKPGKEYQAKVRLCKISKDADGNEVYNSSAYKTSEKVTLKESTKPSLVIEYDKAENAIKVKSDVAVSGELYINSAVNDGQWYVFSDKAKELVQRVDLPDGDYTVEFHATDEDGDHAIVQNIVSIDTTAPIVMIASPMSGDTFSGDSVILTATADKDAKYSFKINNEPVSPKENDIFASGMLKCTLPVKDADKLASINIEINAKDEAGNETVKELVLINKKITEITSVNISSVGKNVVDGKLELGEGESAQLVVWGKTANGETIDITDMNATKLEVTGGTSVKLDGCNVTAGFAGRTLIRADFALGGNEFLYDGIVIETTDKTLIYSALEEVLEEAKNITNDNYTDESWNKLQEAITGAQQVMEAEGVTQVDLDNAATAVSNAISGLKNKESGSSRGGSTYYTVLFNTNGGGNVADQRIKRGNNAVKPNDPIKQGYTFDGWYSDKMLTTPYDFADKVTKTFTLYAKWIENENVKENPFIDVSEDDWFYDDVQYVYENGLMKGMSDTIFAPNKQLTRAMLVTVIYRVEGEPDAEKNTAFGDVDENAYYANAVMWAQQNGIVNGVTEDTFAPDRNITREQIAAIMHRYAKYKGYDVSAQDDTNILSYTDAEKISEYAIPSIQYAVGTGLMKGKTENTLNPQDNATRAEAAAILQRFIEANK